jgi:hypothetical protein
MPGWMKVSDIVDDIWITVTVKSVNRVNWLRAKARSKRWEEEILILKHEMIWTQLWFGHQKKKREARMEMAIVASKPGHRAYAAKQAKIWAQFLEHAQTEFVSIDGISS